MAIIPMSLGAPDPRLELILDIMAIIEAALEGDDIDAFDLASIIAKAIDSNLT